MFYHQSTLFCKYRADALKNLYEFRIFLCIVQIFYPAMLLNFIKFVNIIEILKMF